jgi:hypothetical protein
MDFHLGFKNETCAALEKMPLTFKTLDEARIWCELLMRWNYHFRAESLAVGKSQEISMKNSPMKWEDAMDTPMGATVLHEPKEIPVALLPEYRARVSRTQQWFGAFEPLSQALRPDKVKDFIGGIMLQVQATMSSVTLASAFFNSETGYDVFLPEFRDIVALAASTEPLSNYPRKRLSYHFDGGFIPPLFLVATKCRDRVLRREAISLLLSAPIREGVFDSICVGKMAQWLMELEEEGVPEAEEIPDHRRVRIRRSNINLPITRAQLQGTQLRRADDLEPEWKETVLTW